jgi:hypothetical protein
LGAGRADAGRDHLLDPRGPVPAVPVPIASISKNPIPILVLVGIALFFIHAGVVSRSPGTLSVTFARQR